MTAPVGEVTTPITRGRNGRGAFALGIEQSLGGQRAAPLVEQRHQSALSRQLHPVDDDLIFRAARIGRQLAGGDDFGAILGRERERPRPAAPDHRVDAGAIVFQGKIADDPKRGA